MPPKLPISDAGVEFGISAKAQREWLKSLTRQGHTRQWHNDLSQWKAQKVLGVGTMAICGLYRRDPTAPVLAGQNQYLVVKQVSNVNFKSLEFESTLLRTIWQAALPTGGTEHVVQLYKEVFRTPGGNFDPFYDPNPRNAINVAEPANNVARIYLEYCSGGNLQEKLIDLPDQDDWSEEELWRLLGCLLRGAVVMDIGSEDSTNQAPNFIPICHFDIKPENIFIGDHNPAGPNHRRLHPFKYGDFGLALPVIPGPGWNDGTEWRGSPGWHQPEQMRGHSVGRIGPDGNVWGIGIIMHFIMWLHGQVDPPVSGLIRGVESPAGWEYTFRTFQADRTTIAEMPAAGFETLGRELLFTDYSRHLVALVHACLAYDPSKRPTAAELLVYVDQVINQFNTLNGMGPMDLGEHRVHSIPDILRTPSPSDTPADTDYVDFPSPLSPIAVEDLAAELQELEEEGEMPVDAPEEVPDWYYQTKYTYMTTERGPFTIPPAPPMNRAFGPLPIVTPFATPSLAMPFLPTPTRRINNKYYGGPSNTKLREGRNGGPFRGPERRKYTQ